MKEVWKNIKGYEGLYQISNLGNVKSLSRTLVRKNGSIFSVKERILKHQNDPKGYPTVTLIYLKNKVVHRVHRLIAEAFIPNPENKPQVDHIDGNRENYNLNNLRWVSSSENHLNPITIKRRKESNSHIGKGLNAKSVIGTSLSNGETIYFSKIKDAEKCGFIPSCITQNARGKIKYHKGYVWKYAE